MNDEAKRLMNETIQRVMEGPPKCVDKPSVRAGAWLALEILLTEAVPMRLTCEDQWITNYSGATGIECPSDKSYGFLIYFPKKPNPVTKDELKEYFHSIQMLPLGEYLSSKGFEILKRIEKDGIK